MNSKGFTLVEMLVVMIIVGVLTVIAIPAFNSFVERARETSVKVNLENAHSISQRAFFDGIEEITDGVLGEYGMRPTINVILSIIDGYEETLVISGWYVGTSSVFVINHDGVISKDIMER